MNVEVIYINSGSEFVETIDVPDSSSVKDALIHSGVLKKFPDVSLDINPVGVFGDIVSLDTTLKDGDRVEIYRPLKLDPMEARRLRAKI